jgi:hypothetical protein
MSIRRWFVKSSYEDLWKRKVCVKFAPHRVTDDQKQQRLVPRHRPDLSRQYHLLYCIFLFPKEKTTLKGRSFRMLKTLRKMWWPNWTLFLWRPLLTIFKTFLSDSTNVFKWAEITLNRNITIFYFLVFFFHTSLGTLLLPEHILPLKLVCFVGFTQE